MGAGLGLDAIDLSILFVPDHSPAAVAALRRKDEVIGRVVSVHASDSAVRGELRPVLLGTGVTPYPALFQRLARAGWDGWI
jgi:sugar phosphate isomerase/epimerase